jgi:hypothetical protein
VHLKDINMSELNKFSGGLFVKACLFLLIQAYAVFGIHFEMETSLAQNPEAESIPDMPANTATYSVPRPAKGYQPSFQLSESQKPAVKITDGFECKANQVCREIGTNLPLRILPRSFSNVYKRRKASEQNIVKANVRAFYPLYVFGREGIDCSDPINPEGWYQVGTAEHDSPLGYMQARDVLEWRQALVVSYTHPGLGGEERQRVLMFQKKENLTDIVDSEDLIAKAIDIYERLRRNELAGGLISKEPERFVDINQSFYLLPIVQFDTVDIEGDEARLLQLAAAVPRQRGPDTLENSEYRSKSMQEPRFVEDAVRDLGIDIVFVVDMTLSMQPYIDHTKQAIVEIARSMSQKKVKQKIRLGLIGYRDDVSSSPDLEFISKNFTPELVDVENFIDILENEAQAATVSSVGFSEEVFAGIETGLQSNWNENSLHFMILVGDSSSHPVGHEQNTTGKDAFILRQAAEDDQIHILSIYLQNQLHPEDQALARDQYSALSKIRGRQEESALVEIDTRQLETFQSAVEIIGQTFSDIIHSAQGGKLDILENIGMPADRRGNALKPIRLAERATHDVAGAALVEYLGREANPPKDIIAWVLDRDLTNPAIRALDVRVLVDKRQLSVLIGALDQVIHAMDQARISQMNFFDALQGVSSQAMKNPEGISRSQTLVESGLLPAFIHSLPYRSEVQSLNAEMYASMTAEQRAGMKSSLRAKLQQYRDINEQVDGWIRLNDADPETSKVYPLHLDYLP